MVIVARSVLPDCDGYTDANLNHKNVVLGAAQRTVLVHVSVQVDVIDPGEVPQEVLLHAIQGGDEFIVGYVADDSGLAGKAVNRPPEESDIRIVVFVLEGRRGVL